MKNILKLILLTFFTAPVALRATESPVVPDPVDQKNEFETIKEMFDQKDLTFEQIEQKITTLSPNDQKALLTFKGDTVEETLLHWLIFKKIDPDITIKTIKLFVEKGAELNAQDKNGDTPLHLTISHNSSIEIITALIQNGADSEIKNNAGGSPFLLAIQNRRLEIIKLFIEKGANINEKLNDEDATLLHIAIYENWNIDFIEYLLKKGADKNAIYRPINGDELTPLFIAAQKNLDDQYRQSLIKILLEYGADPSIKCCYLDKPQTVQEYYIEHYPCFDNDASAIALFATQPDPEKIKLIEKPKVHNESKPFDNPETLNKPKPVDRPGSPNNSSWSTSSKVGLTLALVATGIGAYYLYTKYQEKKKLNAKKKIIQKKKEKLEKIEQSPAMA